MRTILSGAGVDTTAVVEGYVLQNNEIDICDLYAIGSGFVSSEIATVPTVFWVTNYRNGPLFSTLIKDQFAYLSFSGVFQQTSIKRSSLSYETGLQATTAKIQWAPSRANLFQIPSGAGGNPSLTLWDHFRSGTFDNGFVRMWRGYLATPGDLDTFGTMEMFLGRISEIDVAADWIELGVKSYLDMLDGQIPRFLIEPSNRSNFWGISGSGNATGQLVLQPLTPTPYPGGLKPTVYAFNGPAGGPAQVYPAGEFAGCYLNVFDQGLFAIIDSYNDGTNNFLVLRTPLGSQPPAGNTNAKIYQPQSPSDQPTSAPGPGTQALAGFPYVPRPEDQI